MPSVSNAEPATPEALLLRFRDTRDADALGALFDLTAPALLRVALSIAPDATAAENALQETFLAVLASPERWDETRRAVPWLLGILHRQVGSVRRDAARRPDPLRVFPPLRPDDPATTASSREEQTRVRAAIDELPEPYRAVAVLRWRHGLDPADIADVRGEPPGTTRSLLSRALEKLRERLGGAALVLFGGTTTRGLAGVRRALMTKATTAAATGTTIGVGGVIVMKKIVAACLAVALLAGGTWWTVARIAKSSDESTRVDVATASPSAPTTERKRTRAPSPETTPAPVVDELPPPIDLDKCDRDLDLFGRVVDEEGKPVAGAKVGTETRLWVRFQATSQEMYRASEAGPKTRTAPDGTFALRLARGNVVDLVVSADGFGGLVRTDCQAGERVSITLQRGATLDITASNESAAPIEGVHLSINGGIGPDRSLHQRFEGVTDAAGHAAFTGVAAGHASISAVHASLGGAEQEVMVSGRDSMSVRLVLSTHTVLRGRVTDAGTGTPIVRANVESMGSGRVVVTDADGRYEFVGWAGRAE